MDSNGIISFKVDSKKYTACFGMKFKGIFGEMLESHEGTDTPRDWFNYMLYAGLCNEAYLNREAYPLFRDVVALVDEIYDTNQELQKQIYGCYENSKVGKEIEKLLQALSGEKKSEVEAESPLVEKSDLQNTNETGQQQSDLVAANSD